VGHLGIGYLSQWANATTLCSELFFFIIPLGYSPELYSLYIIMHMIIFMALVCVVRSPSRMYGVYVFLIFSYRKKKKMNERKRPLDFLDIKLEETLEISRLEQF